MSMVGFGWAPTRWFHLIIAGASVYAARDLADVQTQKATTWPTATIVEGYGTWCDPTGTPADLYLR